MDPRAPNPEQPAATGAPNLSEDCLALRFTERHGNNLRFFAPWGKWLQWTDSFWMLETTLLAFHLARIICREASAECKKSTDAKAIARAAGAVETLAKADRQVAAVVDQWNAEKLGFNSKG